MGKHRYIVAVAVNTLEKFMEIQFGATRFRVLDVASVDEQNLLFFHVTTCSISACNIQK